MIKYLAGDALSPAIYGRLAIVHVCNDIGAFGAGFAADLAERHPRVQRRFQLWAKGDEASGTMRPFRLGAVQWIGVGEDLIRGEPPDTPHAGDSPRPRWHRFSDRWVVNMVAQRGLRSAQNPIPLRLDALTECLAHVAANAGDLQVVMPRIGCGLAGGNWADVEPVIEATLGAAGVPIFVFDRS